jgi:hypothetical protein
MDSLCRLSHKTKKNPQEIIQNISFSKVYSGFIVEALDICVSKRVYTKIGRLSRYFLPILKKY